MNDFLFILLIYVGIPVLLIGIPALIGVSMEKKQVAALDRRSASAQGFLVTDTTAPPPGLRPQNAWLVEGSTVVGAHRGKLFLSQIRAVFGGEMKAITTTNDIARREAKLRMIESAQRGGAVAIINLRVNHSSVSSGKQIATEILVTGTAVS